MNSIANQYVINGSQNVTMDLDTSTLSTDVTLESLNKEEVTKRLGAIVFVSFLSFIGIIGNIHVLYIYGKKFKKTNQRIFILFLGLLDLFTCLVGMPFIVSDLLLPLMFTSNVACKVLRCTNYFTGGSSAFLLVVISIDRYKKICHPLSPQWSRKRAKIMSGMALLFALLLSWPAAIFYGKSSVELDGSNLIGSSCYIADKYRDTKYTFYFNTVIILIIIAANIVLITLYINIGRRVYKQKRFRDAKKPTDSSSRKPSFLPGQVTKVVNNEFSFVPASVEVTKASEDDLSTSGYNSTSHNLDVENKALRKKSKNASKKTLKVTWMLFIITLVYFISFIPHLILKILADVKKDFLPNLNFSSTFAYYIFLYTIFINNVANPIIYGFCDQKFMEIIKTMYRRPCLSDD